MRSFRRLTRSSAGQRAIGTAAAQYLWFVWRTTRSVLEPADIYERIDSELPIIIAMWHGQHFLMPFIKRPQDRGKVLVSRHRDGEINAIAAARFGIDAIRGSGTHGTDFTRKGGVYAFKEIVASLNQGYTVAMTADVPKVARVAGLGIVKIAQASGRPIYPMAIATSRRIVLKNWDRTTINLPFSRCGRVVGSPVHVPADADTTTLELARKAVEDSLNAATARAYELADGAGGGHVRG
jgi:lysophospholipid acyltransferase (LPLAT)-like uncharacterized protein